MKTDWECEWIKLSENEISKLVRLNGGVAILPLASIESHGPHLPLGSDLLVLRKVVSLAVQREPALVLPELPYSYVLEATKRPGAVHIDSDLLMKFVETICDEAARNGCRKIILAHGHGGNVALHWMFCKRILERDKNYAVYSVPPLPDMGEFLKKITNHKFSMGHACEMETSMVMAVDANLVKLRKVAGKIYKCEQAPAVGPAYTTVEWISRWPKMVVGNPSLATSEKGEIIIKEWSKQLAEIIKKVKNDSIALKVMKNFRQKRKIGGVLD